MYREWSDSLLVCGRKTSWSLAETIRIILRFVCVLVNVSVCFVCVVFYTFVEFYVWLYGYMCVTFVGFYVWLHVCNICWVVYLYPITIFVIVYLP